MKILNFDFRSEDINLEGLGYFWDLHNFAKFNGFKYSSVDNSLELEWRVPKADNPWGCVGNRHIGCQLRFDDLQSLRITGYDSRLPFSEGACLHAILKMYASRVPDQLEAKIVGIRFELQNQRTIEIEADTVELIAL